jgi:pilus assembly protein CpaE
LLVDGYLGSVAPDAETLGKTFNLEVIAVLAANAEVRLNAKNQGVSLFELAPREKLTQSLRALGERLAKRSEGLAKPKVTWFDRLRGTS